ncbi:type I-D CRISPR-associated protein Cas5/Csc1 [Myxacorys almedinensis]|uniref:Type I-D CRISPR-associated protein Cas5/Csc1 n=1 Tax=Myxacorys almedinensis A TaxID=2690445 RepID=A0A8J7Z6N1_9CYAN|nr:type I-D CRISPR-associated protein Cas5/Csc1 [Myxacorys almedinensis]NDJ19043.1 type I-D CRISPR-associated protein Cas5/Csc1 [Myxacorys almedinensis A]
MPFFYRCTLELHDSLYFATRELGRLYETEPVIHNYALAYAIGLIDSLQHNTIVVEENAYRYFCAEQVPKYKEHLTPLNNQGIYVTPARAIFHTTTLNTWKYADNRYHVEMQPTERNIPSFGRTKEIAPESQFEFFIVSERSLTLPRWIRLGKWASKAELIAEPLPTAKHHQMAEFTVPYLLNPLDVMFTNQILSYDTVNMPPVSLIRNVRLCGEFYTFEGLSLKIPAQMHYRFG